MNAVHSPLLPEHVGRPIFAMLENRVVSKFRSFVGCQTEATTAKLIAFENDMIPSYGLERRGYEKLHPSHLKNNSGRDAQQKQEKNALTALWGKAFVVFGHSLVRIFTRVP